MTDAITKLDELHAKAIARTHRLYFGPNEEAERLKVALACHYPAMARVIRAGEELSDALDPRCWCRDITGDSQCPACHFREALEAMNRGGCGG